MKIATWLILAVVAVLTLCTIVAAVLTALQILVYAIAAFIVIGAVTKIATYFSKEDKQPPV